MKIFLTILAAFAISACATTEDDTGNTPLLKAGQCVASSSSANPETNVLDVGSQYYVFSVTQILAPAGLGVLIKNVDKQLIDGRISVVDCYPVEDEI